MSSRQEEKERRRREREALEQKAKGSDNARKRVGIVALALAAVAIIAVVGLAVGGVLGGGDDGKNGGDRSDAPTFDVATLEEAAELAKCKVEEQDEEGSSHTDQAVKYTANPPTSGDHDPVAAEEGEYDLGNPPDLEQSVHALEHGRINVQYKAGSPANRIAQLRGMVDEEVKGEKGYKTLLFQNQTGMTPAVAATAWQNALTCPQWNDRVFDAIRLFREEFVDKGPEFIP